IPPFYYAKTPIRTLPTSKDACRTFVVRTSLFALCLQARMLVEQLALHIYIFFIFINVIKQILHFF
ncbi:MAG: hypothetical protein PHY08_03775, partial [Candidatus Cloacimonetes bacterium]|nr:hypothetical protein [Candidatus Cloacimonadota bacterium]